jgi:axial budding pattern protein 2
MALWVAAVALFSGVIASPQVNFPLNLQYPPIARVGEPYSFQFAETTFQPDPEKLQYSLIGNPSWLSLDGKTRTLSGKPGAGDTGTATFTITAAGEAGAVANMESKLLVTDAQAPAMQANISESLGRAGPLTGPKTLTLLPSKPFEIQFSSDSFDSQDKNISYQATLADHTPLPAWISFDAASLQFAGTTPPVNTSPQSFDLILIACDGSDFAVASISFTLIVSNHQLLFKPLNQTMKLNKGDEVKIEGLQKNLFLDNASIRQEDIKSAEAELPSWLSFDNHTFVVSGTPPSGLMSQDISITVIDQFGDTAKQSVHLIFISQLFDEEVGKLNITLGQYFQYQISKSVLLNNDERITMNFGSLGEWLEFNPDTLTISGTVPSESNTHDVEATMTATSKDGKQTDTQTFTMSLASSSMGDHPDAKNPISPGQPSDKHGSSGKGDQQHHPQSKEAVVAGAAVGAVVCAVILFAFGCILCRRKKTTKGYISPRAPRSPRKTDISRPIMIQDEWDLADKSSERDLEKAEAEDPLLERTPEHPPQLNLNLLKRKDSHSPASSIGERELTILNEFDNSQWGFKDDAGPSHRPHDSMKIPTFIARRELDKSDSLTKHRRRTTAVYRDSGRSAGLPINRRITGLGHGRHTYSPSQSNSNMVRRQLSFHSGSSKYSSILSAVPSAAPQPSAARHTTQLTTPMEKRFSIRVVSKDATSSTYDSQMDLRMMDDRRAALDRRTIDERRRSYIRRRVSTQSPFFGAFSSRVESASYKSPPGLPETPSKLTPSPLATSGTANQGDYFSENVERELPESLRIRKPSETPSVEPPRVFAGSLRKPPTPRSFLNRHTTSTSITNDRDRVYKPYQRPGTAVYCGSSRRSSTRQSLRAQELKASLNDLTGSKIYEDAELSLSEYSDEEDEIEDYEKRTTIKPNQFALQPLDLYRLRKRDSKSKSGRETPSKGESKRPTRRISQRDPTPFARALEHGGKENQSSIYSLKVLPSATTEKGKGKAKDVSKSPERPKTIAVSVQRPIRPDIHSRNDSRTTARSSTTQQRHPQSQPLSRQHSHRSRHSRPQSKSGHSRSQSRHSNNVRPGRDRARTQSSAFPYFDISTLSSTLNDPSKPNSNKENHQSLPQKETQGSILTRDLSGSIIDYGLNEEPAIEELVGSSIGFRTSNGRINSGARRSRLMQQMSESNMTCSTRQSRTKRDTTVHTPTPSIGLGLSLYPTAESSPINIQQLEQPRHRERTPLSTLSAGNGASSVAEHVRIVESKAKRPVSTNVNEELRIGASRKGRTTWGSLKRVAKRGASYGKEVSVRAVSGGKYKGYWEGKGESKAFL